MQGEAASKRLCGPISSCRKIAEGERCMAGPKLCRAVGTIETGQNGAHVSGCGIGFDVSFLSGSGGSEAEVNAW